MGSSKPAGILGSISDASTSPEGAFGASSTPDTCGFNCVSVELGACYVEVRTSIAGLSFQELQVLAWLRQHQPKIIEIEARFGVDRRAIAGAIAWEMLKNVKLKINPLSYGPGKIHRIPLSLSHWFTTTWTLVKGTYWEKDEGYGTAAYEVEARGYLPKQTYKSRSALLSTGNGAIPYIGAIMRAFSDVSVKAGFGDLSDNPVILTNLYQGRTISEFEEYLKTKPKGSPFAGGNTMDIWVGAHLDYLEDAVGAPAIQSEP